MLLLLCMHAGVFMGVYICARSCVPAAQNIITVLRCVQMTRAMLTTLPADIVCAPPPLSPVGR